MRRVRLSFAGREIEFDNRDFALKQVEDWVNRGMALPRVVYGPEGCRKTTWLRQTTMLLKELDFEAIYVNPVESVFMVKLGIMDLRDMLMKLIRETTSQVAWGRVVWSIIGIARSLIEAGTRKLVIIVDDAFQVIGIDKAAVYVKGLLGILEHPPASYDKVIAIAATSEGVSLGEIGRHSWSDTAPIWNMSKDITPGFVRRWLSHLREAVEDPDYLWFNVPEELINELVRRNLIMHNLLERKQTLWIDQPPPERDLELGIGKHTA